MPDAQARDCLTALRTIDLVNQKMDLTDQQMQSLQREQAALQTQLRADDQMLGTWQQRALDAEKKNTSLEHTLTEWYHNPWVMLGVGVATGAVATSVIVVMTHY